MVWPMIRLVLRRPWLIPALLQMGWASRRRDWYARPPFLPLPSARYLQWRMETAYGDSQADPPPADVARFLKWARRLRKSM